MNVQTVKEFIDKVKAGGNKDVTLFMYPGEGHGFMNGGEDIHKMMKSESYNLLRLFTACMTHISCVCLGHKAVAVCCSCKIWQADAHVFSQNQICRKMISEAFRMIPMGLAVLLHCCCCVVSMLL